MSLACSSSSGLGVRSGTTHRLRASTSNLVCRPSRVVVARAAETDADADLEKRLEKLRLAKGATPYGQGVKATGGKPVVAEEKSTKPGVEKVTYDFSGETVFYEGRCHPGDLLVNLALGTTLVWLPLTAAAIGRAAFVTYKFTDKRISVATNAPWKSEQTDVAYQEVKDVITVSRGVGLWGDMVVTLKDNSKIEIRSLDRFKEIRDYILQRRDEVAPQQGFVTAEQLLGEPVSAKKKGFA